MLEKRLSLEDIEQALKDGNMIEPSDIVRGIWMEPGGIVVMNISRNMVDQQVEQILRDKGV